MSNIRPSLVAGCRSDALLAADAPTMGAFVRGRGCFSFHMVGLCTRDDTSLACTTSNLVILSHELQLTKYRYTMCVLSLKHAAHLEPLQQRAIRRHHAAAHRL